jgi:outer membrane protein
VRIATTDPIPTPDQDPVQPLQDLVAEAIRRRPDVREAGLQLVNSQIGLTGSRSALLPSLDLVASTRTNALFGQVNPLPPVGGTTGGATLTRQPDPLFVGGLGQGITQIFGARFPDYGVELQLNVPLSNRAARADYARDQLNLRQQQIRVRQIEKQVRVDVVNALIAVEQAKAAYAAAEQERILQEQALEAERLKYGAGVSTTYFVIQYQRDLAQAQASEVAAQADYVKARNALDRSAGRLLQSFGISIEDAFNGRMPANFSGPPIGAALTDPRR